MLSDMVANFTKSLGILRLMYKSICVHCVQVFGTVLLTSVSGIHLGSSKTEILQLSCYHYTSSLAPFLFYFVVSSFSVIYCIVSARSFKLRAIPRLLFLHHSILIHNIKSSQNISGYYKDIYNKGHLSLIQIKWI